MAALIRRTIAVLSLFAGAACEAASACESPPPFESVAEAESPTHRDQVGRIVAPITVDGQGPFRFIIDTGANRSVLSSALAARLGLTTTGSGEVHSIEGVHQASLVMVDELSLGPTLLSRGHTPVIDGPMLAGEQGILGVDGMAGRVLHVDFERRCVEIFERGASPSMSGWVTINGRMRFGALILAEGDIQGVKVNVLIDTGASISLANQRFRDALGRVQARVVEYRGNRAFTFGRPVILKQSVWTPRMRVGETWISRINAYIGDFHIFDLWGLQEEPTLLIGMDVLARTRQMAINYESGQIHFRARPRGDW
jgi:predicted aspartyl protease